MLMEISTILGLGFQGLLIFLMLFTLLQWFDIIIRISLSLLEMLFLTCEFLGLGSSFLELFNMIISILIIVHLLDLLVLGLLGLEILGQVIDLQTLLCNLLLLCLLNDF